jgi:hypothetical protein
VNATNGRDDEGFIGLPDDAGDAISEIARERRLAAERESTREKPAFLTGIEQSEILYTFRPLAMPYSTVDPVALSAKLEDIYGLRLARLDLSPLLNKMSKDQVLHLETSEALKAIVRAPESQLRWEDGRFPLRNDFVGIRGVSINFESILVVVAGVSEVAEVVAQEIVELMWRLSGAKKAWQDVQQGLMLTGYGTATRVDLGFASESLLAREFTDFLRDKLENGPSYARYMGRQATPDEQSVVAVSGLDELHMKVSRFDPSAGNSSTSMVRFSVTARSDFRRGRMLVTTEMPFDKHMDFLGEIFDAIRPH